MLKFNLGLVLLLFSQFNVWACPSDYPLEFPNAGACGKLDVGVEINRYHASFNSRTKTFNNITVTDPSVDHGNIGVLVSLSLIDDFFHSELSPDTITKVSFRNFMTRACGLYTNCEGIAEAKKWVRGSFMATLFFARKTLNEKSPMGDWNIEITVQRKGIRAGNDTVVDRGYYNL